MLLEPEAYTVATWVFLRGIGVASTVAFVSLMVQLEGLYGRNGILPISETVAQLRSRGVTVAQTPTLFRFGASDRALWTVCAVGLAASVLVTLDILAAPSLVVAWVCYLSFSTVGRDFLSYQWDMLLLEVLVVGAVLAVALPTPEPALWLVWFLLIRLMLQSGAAKLLSRDETWRDGTALTYHHETQPLPTRFAWHLHQLPRGAHVATTWAVLAIELVVPLLLLSPWPWRAIPIALLLVLQVGILLSGNYGFFNLLAIGLLLPLVPDGVWVAVLGDPVGQLPATGAVTWWLVVVAAGTLLALNAVRLVAMVRPWPWAQRLLQAVGRVRLANRYGLFAVMTTTRPEIVLQGSQDGERWTTYRFRYDPTDLRRPPRWNAPHQPRLDWQLWFAALGTLDRNPWFLRFCERLLAGARPVCELLAEGPDPDSPPRFLRADLYRYTFTDRATRRGTGRWWDREPIGTYCPLLTLRHGKPVPVGRSTP
ncbi:MAG: lipase maturation factor family protein [Actinobacteria bacterium]|nr:lipase maturation factor family protein [Actinomycetota bacterium]